MPLGQKIAPACRLCRVYGLEAAWRLDLRRTRRPGRSGLFICGRHHAHGVLRRHDGKLAMRDGALLFIASDSFLSWNMFVSDIAYSDVLIMGTYYVAQFLLAGSIRHQSGAAHGKRDVTIQ
ncbi:lysoplasmalogenase family protein [Paenibacillus sp. JTLBN-2024]